MSESKYIELGLSLDIDIKDMGVNPSDNAPDGSIASFLKLAFGLDVANDGNGIVVVQDGKIYNHPLVKFFDPPKETIGK